MGTNTIVELLNNNMGVYEKKAKMSFVKLALLGIFAGIFIAIGASSSSAAVYGIANTGLAKTLAGAIFPVGLILVVMVGGELFTGDCLMVFGVMDKRFSLWRMLRTLVIVYVFNLIGSLIVALIVSLTGQFDYSSGLLGASVIKTAVAKVNIPFYKAFFSGIMCNILVCLAVLLAGVCRDGIGKIFACFFPIWAFVIGGYEHCVANMYYIPAGILAKGNYSDLALSLGVSSEQLESLNFGTFFVNNLIPVTLGNIVGGMLIVALPLYIIHRKNIKKDTNA